MRVRIFLFTTVIFGLCFPSCQNPSKKGSEKQTIEPANQNSNTMKSHVSIFEIPANEISRAIEFYQAILAIDIEKIDMPDMQMGIWPYEEQMVTGVIIKAEGYKPSAEGVTIYLNGGDNLQVILDRVEKNGGKILVPKSLHADESGFFAQFLDSEGNKMGLHSLE
ncbi:VOC family protein [Pararhodonellum marinum]|uniref:VOC family protein n=1 Tax=Pararhodonellum marinum TaxID=2755358 RepID=UPI001E29BA58|nr:VOC family protein [Pararhodonellum marinum]